jgi:5-methylcytosine-specific restriction endonuclease McrA
MPKERCHYKRTRYCSIDCARTYNGERRSKPKICANCGKEFTGKFLAPYSKSTSKYCSDECRLIGFRKTSDITRKTHKISPVLQPANAYVGYKKRLGGVQQCADCGFLTHPEILIVHHRDGRRDHNHLENLVLLCPNCHTLRHRQMVNGPKKQKAIRMPPCTRWNEPLPLNIQQGDIGYA